jgi:hypothetical protein
MPGRENAATTRTVVRIAPWMLAASVLLFASSLWIAVGRTGDGQPPVATVRQIMDVIVIPASTVVYSAASTVSTSGGTVDTAPRTDEDWRLVAANAAALAEAGALLRVDGRAHRGEAWMKPAQMLSDAATRALAAARAKNVDALLEAGGEIAEACDSCHAEYPPNGGR